MFCTNIMSNSWNILPPDEKDRLTHLISFAFLKWINFLAKDQDREIPKRSEGLFSSFYRSLPTWRIFKEPGLDFAIVKEFVVMHGGTIEVVSGTPTKEATFIISSELPDFLAFLPFLICSFK